MDDFHFGLRHLLFSEWGYRAKLVLLRQRSGHLLSIRLGFSYGHLPTDSCPVLLSGWSIMSAGARVRSLYFYNLRCGRFSLSDLDRRHLFYSTLSLYG